MTTKTRTFTTCACVLLLFVAEAVSQTPTPTPASTPGQLTTEQKAMLSEVSDLNRRVVELNKARKFDEAIPLAQRVIKLRTTVLGENDSSVALAISNLGALYIGKQDYEVAETEFRKALTIYQNAGRTDENMGYVLDSLALLSWSRHDYSKAEAYAKTAIELKQKIHGDQSPQLIQSLNHLIKIYTSAEKTSQRNALYSQVLSIFEKNKEKTDRSALFQFRCTLGDGKQTPEVFALKNRIDSLLDWQGPAQASTSLGVVNGRAVSLMKPEYPYEARAARVSGVVVVDVEIDECGKVSNANVVSGPSALKSASERAAKLSRFTPTFIDGFPVKVRGTIHFNFMSR